MGYLTEHAWKGLRTMRHSKPVRCFKCGKSISEPAGGAAMAIFGANLRLSDSIEYPCKSCGAVYCLDCMSELKKSGICPYCRGDIGW